ncbi:MAG TPA: sugar ABC transporter substrate-binding protein [Actinobacteria bacterium]|jgi:D-xylose transport system substrate-binding protein|nr:sugar ABC transporter substrate-binding protein [Actinomycetota bacterium]
MSKKLIGAVAGLAAASLLVAACSSSSEESTDAAASPEAVAEETAAAEEAPAEEAAATASGKACVILPDAASSARWETADRPFLEQAFQAAGVEYDIQNANGDKAKFQTIADGMLAGGCGVLAIVNLDSETGSAVIAKATAAGVPVIDYDRLTLGGGAQYYVSFDNVAVGTAIGEGLVKCLGDAGVTEGPVALLNGSPTDNNATLFKQGYQAALEGAGFTVAADQAVPDWDNTKAGTIFEQMYTDANGDFVAVAAANDGLGGAAISVLDRNGQAGAIPVSGQDATDEGLQRVLMGTQCVTVYKAVAKEAAAAAALAVALLNGDTAAADALATGTTTDSEAGTEVPSVLLEPQPIYADTVIDVINDGFTTADKICTTDELKAKCAEFGIQ